MLFASSTPRFTVCATGGGWCLQHDRRPGRDRRTRQCSLVSSPALLCQPATAHTGPLVRAGRLRVSRT